ncbi:hypothetical protein ASH00_11790 [Arthrobacter sp. Soil782]|uniref:hypothetical protein n=1 Tax=Arthrobacter sp. Soil782 TaxID=1736410 RepID=UPI0006FED5BA|nr:hypothetical protein [Arthrobacter sp. Soil782]KRF05110.1 hypothetical protein ASH00_11790 [Arthrobacter sp. Soil782]
MSFNSKITSTQPFPESLRTLPDRALHVLNSKIHRAQDAEYLLGTPEMETEFRKEELREEISRREESTTAGPYPALRIAN